MIRLRKFRLTLRASQDLIEIYRFLVDKNRPAADRLIIEIQQKIEHLARLGITGVPKNEISDGLRAVHYRGYLIYFRVVDEEILVMRIRHGRQNTLPKDFPESDTD